MQNQIYHIPIFKVLSDVNNLIRFSLSSEPNKIIASYFYMRKSLEF